MTRIMMDDQKTEKEVRNYRPLTPEECSILEGQGCYVESCENVKIEEGLDLSRIRNVRFKGNIEIGKGTEIFNVKGSISNCRIGRNVRIENVARIEYDNGAQCGVGVKVSPLDETGSRPVVIYPGLSSQVATLMARDPKWLERIETEGNIHEFLDTKEIESGIGDETVITDSGSIINVNIGNNVVIEGALSLRNGSIVNSGVPSRNVVYIGHGVEAENFIIEDGKIDSGARIKNCYVGQGAELSGGLSAHDSLFFANCSFENGETCAVLAGPYSVSMHKGTLLIGCQTSFMNAGSSTNESNHMYKLGPVHWGVLERGVKTASGAYIMFGAKIGAFSMIMGSHKTHPDSSEFPFSYLFGDERGATVVVPGAMLRSCGLLRDEQKWPTRDRRQKRKLKINDRITFDVLNPMTVDAMLNAIDTIGELLAHPADDDLFLRYKGMKFTRASLERAKYLYTLAIFKYLDRVLPQGKFPESDGLPTTGWVDLGGQIIPRDYLVSALEKTTLEETEALFDEAYANYDKLQLEWIGRRFGDWWRANEEMISVRAKDFDGLIEEDRQEYLSNLEKESQMLAL